MDKDIQPRELSEAEIEELSDLADLEADNKNESE
jgi:hypothetical protein